MVSGYFYKDDAAIKNALKQGIINGFVSKPFLHQEICEIVENQDIMSLGRVWNEFHRYGIHSIE